MLRLMWPGRQPPSARTLAVVANPTVSEKRLRRNLAQNVRRLRHERGLTLEAASDLAGVNSRHFQKLEAGEVNATLRTLARLADALGVRPEQLLT